METKYYGQDKEIDQAVERIIGQEVLCNQSYLVDALLSADFGTNTSDFLDIFYYEEIENLYPDPTDWDVHKCHDYCGDHGIDADGAENDVGEWRDAIRENAEPAEIFEWWLVSPWLAHALRELHEPILAVHNGYGGIWWGRTCTGQAIALDPTFYDIYARNH